MRALGVPPTLASYRAAASRRCVDQHERPDLLSRDDILWHIEPLSALDDPTA
jgi:hypothetical protein